MTAFKGPLDQFEQKPGGYLLGFYVFKAVATLSWDKGNKEILNCKNIFTFQVTLYCNLNLHLLCGSECVTCGEINPLAHRSDSGQDL